MDQRGVRGIDKDMQRHPAVAIGKLMADDLADLHAVEVNRRAVADFGQAVGDQGVGLAADQPLLGGRGLDPGKRIGAGLPLPRQHADIGA